MEEVGTDESDCAQSDYAVTSFKKTCNYWRNWMGHCKYNGRWREAVHRSALALKLLTSRRHGSTNHDQLQLDISGDLRKARFLFEKMLSYANDLASFPSNSARRANSSATSHRPSPTWL